MLQHKELKELKLITPVGRRLYLTAVLSFCYGLSETDLQVLQWLIEHEGMYSVDDLTKEFKLSRATINRVLSKLADAELVKKEKQRYRGNVPGGKRTGRPRYIYYVDKKELYEKLVQDISMCAEEIMKFVSEYLREEIGEE
ncbi:MAG: MarR family transcriptional regulator [Desulfurococcales archaeon]|nr:MarR family transcriptional regulator [Desulfurococcales archaeon]